MVYIREAHPIDGRIAPENQRQGIEIESAKTEDDRKEVAKTCGKELKLSMPFLLDDMKDTAGLAYDGWPDRLFVIDREGRIAYRGAPGPKGFKVDEADAALRKLLEPGEEKKPEPEEK